MKDAPEPSGFQTTHWSVVLNAGQQSSPDCQRALAELCETYWYPLYAYARRRTPDAHQAQDLTQGFFAHLLEKNVLACAEPDRGRFRSFLLTSLKNFMVNEWNKAQALKRGGGRMKLSLDFERGESRYQLEPADDETPESSYNRQWAVTLTGRVLQMLKDEAAAAGKAEQFEVLSPFLAGAVADASYGDVAARLNTSEGAARVAVHRLRRRYGELLRSEIAQTVASLDEVDDEIHNLFAAFQ